MIRFAIWYHLHNLKNVKITHVGLLLLVKLQAKSVFFTFFKLYKWYRIAQNITFYLGKSRKKSYMGNSSDKGYVESHCRQLFLYIWTKVVCFLSSNETVLYRRGLRDHPSTTSTPKGVGGVLKFVKRLQFFFVIEQ